jgi:hypothetical protein
MLTGITNDDEIDESMAKSFQRRKEYAEEEARSLAEMNESRRQELETARAEVVCDTVESTEGVAMWLFDVCWAP